MKNKYMNWFYRVNMNEAVANFRLFFGIRYSQRQSANILIESRLTSLFERTRVSLKESPKALN